MTVRCRVFRHYLLLFILLLKWTLPVLADEYSDRCSSGHNCLLPLPASTVYSEALLPLPRLLAISVEGNAGDRLSRALTRFERRVFQLTGRHLSLTRTQDGQSALLRIKIGGAADYPSLETNESYHLNVSHNGIVLSAPSVYGALWGLQTLLQLIEVDGHQLLVPFSNIEDSPRFAWRGMLLDTVRHWMPPDTVMCMLDSMEAVKLNVLHLHLSDDQAFRMASERFPELQNKASRGDYYSRRDMRNLIEYAADRGIRIVPEFGLPGHSGSWQRAYPILAVQDADGDGGGLQSIMFSNPIDPSREEVYELINAFVAEMADVFPDRYWHIGGDEVNAAAWENSAAVQAFMAEKGLQDHLALQAYFSQRYNAIVERHGKQAIGWDEILHPDLPSSTIVHAWRADAKLDFRDHQVLVSANYYLDQQHPASMMYRFDPLNVLKHSTQPEESAVLGAEIANWSESIDHNTVDIRTWPRAAALAELFWSPRSLTSGMEMSDLYRRIAKIDNQLALTGSLHRQYHKKKIAELAGAGDAQALQLLASVIEPTSFHMMQFLKSGSFIRETASAWWRGGDTWAQHREIFFRVDELADYLPGESEVARVFHADVSRLISDPSNTQQMASVRRRLTQWRDNHEQLEQTIADSKPLSDHDIESVSEGLQALATIGLISLDALYRGEQLDERDYQKMLGTLSEYAYEYQGHPVFSKTWFLDFKPLGLRQHRLAIYPAISALLEASAPAS